MRRWFALSLLGCAALTAQQAPIPTATETPSSPFAIRTKWVIGGVGDWGYLTFDPAARQLFIAHGPTVQVVDASSGTVAGTVTGFRDAHHVVLNPNGQVAYVSDGPANAVRIFDRRSFRIIATVPTGPSPHSVAFEPSSGLLVALCTGPTQSEMNAPLSSQGRNAASRNRPAPAPPRSQPSSSALSIVTLIDPEKRVALANVILPGRLGFAQADGSGAVYVTVNDRNGIERLSPRAIESRAERELGGKPGESDPAAPSPRTAIPRLDWSTRERIPDEARPRWISIGTECQDPRGVAVDTSHNRLFVACSNQKMAVVNLDSGALITSLTIGPGADAIAYDPNHDLIFTANGGGYGSLSVIHQHVTDSYAVVQNLPTMQQARTLAVDPSSGEVYLVTTLYGAKLGNPPMNGIGTLKLDPVDGSFQVLVIGQ